MSITEQWDDFNCDRDTEQNWRAEDMKCVNIPKAILMLLLLIVFWYIFVKLWIASDFYGSEVLLGKEEHILYWCCSYFGEFQIFPSSASFRNRRLCNTLSE